MKARIMEKMAIERRLGFSLEGLLSLLLKVSFLLRLAELKNYMRQFGQIHSCLILKDNGKSRGFGFVTFAAHEVAAEVAAHKPHRLHDKEFGCSLILSNKAAKDKQIDKKNRKVYIKVRDKVKLVYKEVLDIFSKYGEVEDVTILHESKERSGFVLYSSKEAVDRLIDAGDLPYKDTIIIIEPCLSRKEIDRAKKTGLNTSRTMTKGPYAGDLQSSKFTVHSQTILDGPMNQKILEEEESKASSTNRQNQNYGDQQDYTPGHVPQSALTGKDYRIKVTALDASKPNSGKDSNKKPKLTLDVMSENGKDDEKLQNQGGFLLIPSVRGENMSHRMDAINSPQHSAEEGKNFLLIPPHRDHYPAKRLSEDFNDKDAAAIAQLIHRSGSTKEIESKTLTLFPPDAKVPSKRGEDVSRSRERDGSQKSTKKAILSSKASSNTEQESLAREPLYKFHRSEQLGIPAGIIGRRKSHTLEVESPSLTRRLSENNAKVWPGFQDEDHFLKDSDAKSANQETRPRQDHMED